MQQLLRPWDVRSQMIQYDPIRYWMHPKWWLQMLLQDAAGNVTVLWFTLLNSYTYFSFLGFLTNLFVNLLCYRYEIARLLANGSYFVNDLPLHLLMLSPSINSFYHWTAKRTENQFPRSFPTSCRLHPMEQRSLRRKWPWRDSGAAGRHDNHSGWCLGRRKWREDEEAKRWFSRQHVITISILL